ncbi:MBL fold metallo-hydrolase [Tardiphaga alba]|uniref:MBL fold metallo-hydrolase n=1 Tax=Tardiphaga alba TaxID=340268 RepID=A0ABX8ABL8_9BRAD|nr:MBL fold metallo-hydrolase [Tardiphaga alba]QUS39828.1 MBL fold metallo-hydrolase [Tardiphaga alba]
MTLDRRTLLQLSAMGAIAGSSMLSTAQAQTAAPAPAGKRKARWICLGTKGGPRVGLGRSNPANVLIVDDVPYVVDCGPGVSKRLVEAKVALPDVRYVFVTHLHSDHVLEYGNMVYGGWSAGLNHPVEAFAPIGMEALTKAYWESIKFDVDIRIADESKPDPRKLLVAKDIKDSGIVLDNGKVKVTAFKTPHPPITENFAYKFETPDGVFVYACDTSFNPALAKFAEGADVLIHETIYVPGVDKMVARVKNAATLKEHLIASHTTTEDVGKIAAMAKVKKLVMTHFVPGDDPTITDEMWAADAKKHYSGPIVVAKDLMEIEL